MYIVYIKINIKLKYYRIFGALFMNMGLIIMFM